MKEPKEPEDNYEEYDYQIENYYEQHRKETLWNIANAHNN